MGGRDGHAARAREAHARAQRGGRARAAPPQVEHLGTARLGLRGGKGGFELEDLAEMDLSEAMPLLLKQSSRP